jgi:geranylgeranyl pyrophosphate synthase
VSAAPVLLAPHDAAVAPPAMHRAFAVAIEREADELARVLPLLGDAPARALGTAGHAAGRRWRPLLSMVTAEACGGDPHRAIPVALAVELTHTASLLLDDLPCMDDAEARRGEAPLHRRLGSAGTILLAVGMLGRAAEHAAGVRPGGERLAATWGRTIGFRGMVGGQAMDLAHTGRGPARGAARRLLREKTTALAAFATEGGARSAGASDRLIEASRRFGRDVGWAYQLADDASDRAEDAVAGREVSGCRPARQAQAILRRAARRVALAGFPGQGADRLITCADRAVGTMLPDRS